MTRPPDLVLLAALLASAPPASPAPRTPIAAADLQVLGIRLRPGPASQVVPLGVPGAVRAELVAAGGNGTPVPAGQLPAAMRVRAELRGPGLSTPLALECAPGGNLPIPALGVEGRYSLDHIRLMDGASLLFLGEPASVAIEVRPILITSVSSRPLSLDEIRERGIVLDPTRFEALEFQVTLALDSGSFTIDIPALIPPDGGPAITLPPLVTPADVGPIADTPAGGPTPDFVVQGFVPKVEIDGEPVPARIAGALVFPQAVGFLRQIHSVLLMVTNGAPGAAPLGLRDLTASFSLPGGKLGRVQTTPLSAAGDPVPVQVPGPDGKLGTADDLRLIVAQATGSAEMVVSGLEEGLHRVDVALAGVVTGMPGGDATIRGEAAGSVLIRNPRFDLTFLLPGVVEEGRDFEIAITLTNTGEVPAHLASLRLSGASIAGATLRPGEDELRLFETIAPRESAVARYQLRALRSGRVSGTRFVNASQNLAGRFELRLAVGEDGVPPSPDVVTLPDIAYRLPRAVADACLAFLGLAWSNATAPAGSLPAGMPQVPTGAVRRLAAQVADAGQRLELGESQASVLSHLLLRLSGGEGGDASLDALRRNSARGRALAEAIAAQLATLPEGGSAERLLDAISSTYFHAAPLLLAALESDPPGAIALVVEDGGDSLALGPGHTLGLLARPAGEIRLRLDASARGAGRLVLVVPEETSPGRFELRRMSFPRLALEAGADASARRDPASGAWSLAGVPPDSSARVPAPPLALLSARVAAEHDPGHHVLALQFNRPLDPDTARALTRYGFGGAAMAGQAALGAGVQAAGRFVYLRLRNPVPPDPPATLEVAGLLDREGGPLAPARQSVTIGVPARAAWGTVGGQALDGRGRPLAGIKVWLAESEAASLGQSYVLRTSAEAVTDAGGRYRFWFARRTGRVLEVTGFHPHSGERAVAMSTLRQDGEALALDLRFLGRGDAIGRVVSPAGIPLARVLVTAAGSAGAGFVQAWSDAEGRFRLEGLPVGAVVVSFKDREGRHAARSILVPEGGSVVDLKDVAIEDRPRGRVEGRVTLGGVAVRGAPVAIRSNGTSPEWGTWVVTDAEGGFAFPAVPAGDVTLTGHDPADWRWTRATATSRLRADARLRLDLTYAGGSGSVAGIVLDAAGRPLDGADVRLGAGPGTRSGGSPGAGRFRFTGVPLGGGSVRLGSGSSLVSAEYHLHADGQEAAVVLRLPALAQVEARVRRNGSFLPGAVVRLRGLGRSCTIVGPGPCLIPEVPLGSYQVDVTWTPPGTSDPEAIEATSVPLALTAAGRTASLLVEIPPRLRISGRTLSPDAGHPPLGGARVSLWSPGLDAGGELEPVERVIEASHATTGEYVFEGVRPGPFALEARSRLIGTLARAGGEAAADRRVDLLFPAEGQLAAITLHVTLPDGSEPPDPERLHLRFHPILPGGPDLEAAGQDHVFHHSGRFTIEVSYPDKLAPTHYAVVSGSAGSDTTIDLRLPGRGRIAGKVLDGQGGPVEGAVVKLRASGWPARVQTRETTSGPGGAFAFDEVREGPVTIAASKDGATGADSGTLGLDALLELNPRFAPARVVSGTLRREDGASAAAGAAVLLKLQGAHGFEVRDATVSGADGSFTLGPASFDAASGSAARVFAFDLGTGRFAALDFVLSAATPPLELRLGARGSVEGFVLDGAGRPPLPGARVTLGQGSSALELPGLALLTSSEPVTGFYRFAGVGEGGFECEARKPGALLAARGGGELRGEGDVARVDLALEPHGSVAGVVERDGRPLGGVTLELWRDGVSGPPLATRQSSADPAAPGEFHFEDLPLGTWVLRASSGDGDLAQATAELVHAGEVAHAGVRLQGFADLDVRLLALGAPVTEPYLVHLTAPVAASLDTSIARRFPKVRRGPVTLWAENLSRTSRGAASATIPPGAAAHEVTLEVGLTRGVAGRLRDIDAATPVAGALVRLDAGAFEAWAETAADGSFRFDHAPAVAGEPLTLSAAESPGPGRARARLAWAAPPADVEVELTIDRSPPELLSAAPPDGAREVPRGIALLEARFSEELDERSSPSRVTLTCGSLPVPLRVETSGRSLLLRPQAPLPGSAPCTLLLRGELEDRAGLALGADRLLRFQTIDDVKPLAYLQAPPPPAAGVPLATAVVIGFSEAMEEASVVAPGRVTVSRNGQPGGAAGVHMTDPLHAALALALAPDSAYTVALGAGLRDLAGVALDPVSFSFTTADTLAPVIASLQVSPALARHPEGSAIAVSLTPAPGSDDIVHAAWLIDGVRQASGAGPGFAATLLVPTLVEKPGGSFRIEVLAADEAGNLGRQETDPLLIASDRPPVVSFRTPADGEEFDLGERVAVAVEAADDVGLRELTWVAVGLVGAAGSATYPGSPRHEVLHGGFAAPASYAPDPIVFTATATDTAGNSATRSIAIRLLETRVFGWVERRDGSRAAGTLVRVIDPAGRVAGSAAADLDGAYSVGLGDGSFDRIEFHEADSGRRARDERDFTLATGQALDRGRQVLGGVGQVSGTLLVAGQPLAGGATVTLANAWEREHDCPVSGATFTCERVPAGGFELTAESAAQIPSLRAAIAPSDDPFTLGGVDIALALPGIDPGGLTPSRAPASGGPLRLEARGQNFGAGVRAFLDGAPLGVARSSREELVLTLPAHRAGTFPLEIRNADGGSAVRGYRFDAADRGLLPASEGFTAEAITARDGNLWVAGSDGLHSYTPDGAGGWVHHGPFGAAGYHELAATGPWVLAARDRTVDLFAATSAAAPRLEASAAPLETRVQSLLARAPDEVWAIEENRVTRLTARAGGIDRSAPAYLGMTPAAAALSGDWLVVNCPDGRSDGARGGAIRVFDMGDFARPTLLGEVRGEFQAMALAGPRLLAAETDFQKTWLRAIDLALPWAPRLGPPVPWPGAAPSDLAVSGERVHAVDRSASRLIRVADLATGALLPGEELDEGASPVRRILLAAGRLYALREARGIHELELGPPPPAAPRLLARAAAPLTGGTRFAVTGSDLAPVPGFELSVGGVPAADVFVTPAGVWATAPAGLAAGRHEVLLRNPGTAAAAAPGGLEYTAEPRLFALRPAQLPVAGQHTLRLDGLNLADGLVLRAGSASAALAGSKVKVAPAGKIDDLHDVAIGTATLPAALRMSGLALDLEREGPLTARASGEPLVAAAGQALRFVTRDAGSRLSYFRVQDDLRVAGFGRWPAPEVEIEPRALAFAGEGVWTAYLRHRNPRVELLDLHSPLAPRVLGAIPPALLTHGAVGQLRAAAGRLVADAGGCVFGIADPARVEPLGCLGRTLAPFHFDGRFAYELQGSTLRILDLANPLAIAPVSATTLAHGGSLVVAGDLALVAEHDGKRITSLWLADRANPVTRGPVELPDPYYLPAPSAPAIAASHAWVSALPHAVPHKSEGLFRLGLGADAALALEGYEDLPVTPWSGQASAAAALGGHLLLARAGGRLGWIATPGVDEAPRLDRLSASGGTDAGGDELFLLGRNLGPGARVWFGGVRAGDVEYVSPGALRVLTPPGSGSVGVRVEDEEGRGSAALPYQYDVAAPPRLRAVLPNAAAASGGTPVALHGAGFAGTSRVVVTQGAVASEVTALAVSADGRRIDLTLPAAPLGAGKATLRVETPRGNGVLADAVVYVDAWVP